MESSTTLGGCGYSSLDVFDANWLIYTTKFESRPKVSHIVHELGWATSVKVDCP